MHLHLVQLSRLAVAVYAESVIPRTILSTRTAYILNLCILPTPEKDSFENFSNQRSEDNDQVRKGLLYFFSVTFLINISGLVQRENIMNPSLRFLCEDWIKFRNYALINQDQVW